MCIDFTVDKKTLLVICIDFTVVKNFRTFIYINSFPLNLYTSEAIWNHTTEFIQTT